MAFPFFAYPHTDLNQPNLDWIIGKIKALEKKVQDDDPVTPDPEKCTFYAPFFSDTSQSDCTIIKMGEYVAMVDLSGYPLADDVLNYLASIGVDHLDACIISHYHGDHVGNYLQILSHIDVSNCTFYLPPPLDASLIIQGSYPYDYKGTEVAFTEYVRNTLNRPIVYPLNNQIITLRDDLTCRFLNCDAIAWKGAGFYSITTNSNGVDVGYTNFNNFSMCSLFQHKNVSVFLSGDIEEAAQALIAAYMINPTVYKIPHHGVNHVGSDVYYNKINPAFAFVEGYGFKANAFKNPEAIKYIHGGVPVYVGQETDSGVVFESTGDSVYLTDGSTGYVNHLFKDVWTESGSGTVNTDVFNTGGSVSWTRIGNLVQLNVSVQNTNAISGSTFQSLQVCSDLPAPAFSQRSPAISNNRSSADALNCIAYITNVEEKGNLMINTRGMLPPANTTFYFGFVYIATDR